MSLELLLTFLTASVFLSLAPGPDNLFVLTQAALYGRRAGILVTLGLCTGLLFHTTIAVLGISSVFLMSSAAFFTLKILGAGYLLYLAWGAWQAAAVSSEPATSPALTSTQLFRRGILMNITNPKVGIFFIAFLPQFTQPAAGHMPLQLLTLAVVFFLQVIVIFSGIALLASHLAGWLRRSTGAQTVLNRVSAAIFAVLALRLVFISR